MKILGIETSCDETGIAIYDGKKGLLADALFSQSSLQNDYGGVVPELASREHILRVLPLINQVLNTAGLKKQQLNGIAYTKGPGLAGALLVGGCVANSIAYGLNIPIIGVHHMEGHLLSVMLEKKKPSLPFLALLVSGGHTQLILVKKIGEYQILGESLDDAAGEAFDKVACMLGLDYPGGPNIELLANQGNLGRFVLPRPMIKKLDLNFSFSGLKTAVLNTILTCKKTRSLDQQTIADIALAFEEAVVDTLIYKCRQALKMTNCQQLVIAGGVSANQRLRNQLKILMEQEKGELFYPQIKFCTDNGAMIAYAGFCRLNDQQSDTLNFSPLPRWSIQSLPPILNLHQET